MKKYASKLLLIVVLIILAVSFFMFDLGQYFTLDNLKEHQQTFERYYEQHGIGKAKYTVSFHDGIQKHTDGSPFYGIKIFKNKKSLGDFIKELESKGYSNY